MEELILKAITGDKDAFTLVILDYEQELYKIAKMRLRSDYDICEAIQNTMILAYKHIKKVKEVKYFKTWIIRILINECKKIYKRKKKESLIDDNNLLEIKDIKNEYENIENELTFNSLIEKLDYIEREIIVLYYNSGFSIKEIGKILHINENTIKTKMRRAKIKLKNYMEGFDYYE